MTLKKIAETPQARFEWWVQSKFNVLPTDPRYLDLTEEQLELIFEHYQLDNPRKQASYSDGDYEKEEEQVEGYSAEEAREEGRLPIADSEHFADPDFDAEWNAEDEVSNSDILPENPSEDVSEMLEEQPDSDIENHMEVDETDEWEAL